MPYYETVSDTSILMGEEIMLAIPQMADLLGIWDNVLYEVTIAYRDGGATLFIKQAHTTDISIRQPLGNDEAEALLNRLGR